MNIGAGMEAGPFSPPPLREVGLWSSAAALVLAAHLAVAYTLQALQPAEPPMEANEPALMIDLAPIAFSTPEAVEAEPVAEDVPVETVEPVDDVAEVAEEEPETADILEVSEPVEPETTETALAKQDVVEPEPVEPEPVEPEITAPEVAAVPPEVAVPLPRPEIVEPEKEQPARKVERKKVEKPKREVAKAEPKAQPKAEPKAKPPTKAMAASRAAKAPKVSPARWQSRLLAWLNRHKRYPRGARSRREEGVVNVSFAIDAAGVVVSARISRSSGNPELDQAALDMLRRASPVPAPPPGVARKIAVPVQFNLR